MKANEEKLEPYMKPLKPEERPDPCRQCRHQHMLRWLLNIPFCQYSEYTCLNRVKRCTDFEGVIGEQLQLF